MKRRPAVTTLIIVVCLSLANTEAMSPPSPTLTPASFTRCSILASEMMTWPMDSEPVRLTLANVPDSLPVPAFLDEPATVPRCSVGNQRATTLAGS